MQGAAPAGPVPRRGLGSLARAAAPAHCNPAPPATPPSRRPEEAARFDFCPVTFVLPGDYALFVEAFRRLPGTTWIMKPVGRAQGRGIFLITKLSQISEWRKDHTWKGDAPKAETYIVQRYVDRPYTVGNKKFDCRLYTLVTSFTPLTVWLYRGGFARFSSARYDHSAGTEDLRESPARSIGRSRAAVGGRGDRRSSRRQRATLLLPLFAWHALRSPHPLSPFPPSPLPRLQRQRPPRRLFVRAAPPAHLPASLFAFGRRYAPHQRGHSEEDSGIRGQRRLQVVDAEPKAVHGATGFERRSTAAAWRFVQLPSGPRNRDTDPRLRFHPMLSRPCLCRPPSTAFPL